MPGTFIDSCSAIIENNIAKGYYQPFSFINQFKKNNLEKYLHEIDIIMQRRNKSVTKVLCNYFKELYISKNDYK